MRRVGWILLVLVASLVGVVAFGACLTLPHHTVSPYDESPEAARAIEARAVAWCTAHGEPAGPPPRPFRFDGCSWFPDRFGESVWRDCCEEHDYAYWCGGSARDRERADARLGECVAGAASPGLGRLMRLGVRVGGHPVVPIYFRWGYGHAYRGGYPSTPSAP